MPEVVCKRCGKTRMHEAKGYCKRCYITAVVNPKKREREKELRALDPLPPKLVVPKPDKELSDRGSIGKAGRPSVIKSPKVNGRSILSAEQQRFIARLETMEEPHLADSAALCGLAEQTVWNWRSDKSPRGRLFKRKTDFILARTNKNTPPDPGAFEDWRRTYVNLQMENPYTGKLGWVGETYEFQRPFTDALNEHKGRILYLVPVRHGKTTIIEHYIVYTLCKDPNARVILVCHSQDTAKERLWKIKQILEDEDMYPELHRVWGPWITKSNTRKQPWSETRIYIAGHSGAHRSPNVRAFGITATTYGARADLIILDDIDDPDDPPAKRDRTYRTITHTIVNRLEPGSGQLAAIGTRCGPDDVAGKLLSNPRWWVNIQKAINTGPDGIEYPLCPELYDLTDLEDARDEFADAFELVFQNNPDAGDSAVFPSYLVESAKGSFETAPDEWERVVSLDPASTGRAAVVCVAYDKLSGSIRVLDCEAKNNPGHDGLFEMLQRQILTHKPTKVVIEAQGGSHFFSDVPAVRRFILDEGAELITFETGVNKNDRQFGIGLIPTLMREEKLRIVNGNDVLARKMRPLVNDLLSYQPAFGKRRRYDTVMALWFACNVIVTGRRAKHYRTNAVVDRLYLRNTYLRRRVGA